MSKFWINQLLTTFVFQFVIFSSNVIAKEIHVTPSNIKAIWGSINPGDRVIFSEGEYREEMILLNNKPWSVSQPTYFVAEDSGKVVIKGSDLVNGWRRSDAFHYIKEWPIEPAQVFVNGLPLTQLAGTVFGGYPDNPNSEYHKLHKQNGGIWPSRVSYLRGDKMLKNSFFYDKTQHKIIINVAEDPNLNKIEVSARRRPFYAEGVYGITLDGLIFEHANTSIAGRGAAVTIIGDDNIIRNVTVRNADLAGIQTVGNRNQILNTVAKYNGQMGVTMRGEKNRVVGVNASFNNTRGFNKWWEAGGFKLVGGGGFNESDFIGNTAIGNNGDGIWFDWKNKNNQIRENVAAYNAGFGIHYELSQSGIIQDNYVYGNGQRGIYLRDSVNCWVTHNMVVANGLEGIAILYTGQKDGNGVEFGGENNKVYSNIVGWNNGGALIMPKGASKLGEADTNVYFGNQKANKFSLGYPSTFSPALYSLADWQKASNLDLGSISSEVNLPKEISDDLTKKTLIKSWASIQNLVTTSRKEKRIIVKNNLLPGGRIEEIGPRKSSESKD